MNLRSTIKSNPVLYSAAIFPFRVRKALRHVITYAVPDLLFDLRHNVNTRGLLEPAKLTLVGSSGNAATQYLAVPETRFRNAIESLGIRYDEYTFIDIGSGKGRAALLAASYAFRRVIGVEFARELYETSLINLSRWKGPRMCSVEFRWQDACGFEFPCEPCVIFMFHPFGPQLISRVIANARTQTTHLVVYVNPVHVDALAGAELVSNSTRYGYATFFLTPRQEARAS